MDTDIPEPLANEFTVYSKSGCPNCTKVKHLLKEKNLTFSVIDCDEYLLEDKTAFLQWMENLIGKEYKLFPMVFDNKKFIGGFNEVNKYVETILVFDVNSDF
jgi:glutaredoxin